MPGDEKPDADTSVLTDADDLSPAKDKPSETMAEPTSPSAPSAEKPRKAAKRRKPPKAKKPVSQVVFHTYPKLVFVWPVIVAGFAFWPLVETLGLNAEVVGWVYLLLVALVVLTIGIDLERDHAVFWLVVFLALFFLGKYLDATFDRFTGIGDVYRFFANRDVAYDPAFGLCLSLLLTPPYLTMWVYARLQHRWRITHNEFEHYSFGRADDSLARGAKRVRSTFPDLLELLLCGAGTLVVYSATGRTELRRIPHVPLIFLVRRRINRLLEVTAVTTEAQRQELHEEEAYTEREEEDAFRGEELGGPSRRDPL
ncbi:MAG: hypothetical protein AAFX76_08975 [Planctomycetota bacterium]